MSEPLHAAQCPADAIGYLRVSTEDQAGPDRTSLADQRKAIEALAVRLGQMLGPVFEDPGSSGATAEARPGFMALLAYCKANPRPRGRPGYVLVLNDSRWGRFTDPEEATFWRVELKKRHGWVVRFAEGDDSTDPLARILLQGIHSAQASAYREAIKANARRGAKGTAERGYRQNEAPFGYRREATALGRAPRVLEVGQRKADDEKVRLTPGPEEEQALVRWIFERYAAGGVSLGSLVRHLAQRSSARRWSRQTVRAILMNPAYAGDVVWIRRAHDAEERRQTPRPRVEWMVTPDAHPPLVSRALFAQIQHRLHLNQRELRRTVGGYPLSGLLRCAHCGEPFIGRGGPKGPPGDPDRYRFY